MSENASPRWGVVATVAEPAALLVAFAAHHLDRGAARVHLYLDRPNPALRAMVGGDDRLVLTDVTEDFCRATLGQHRPKRINRRQIVLANHALSVTDTDWLLHLDADEFLISDNPAPALAAVPDDILGLRIANGERVFVEGAPRETIFDGPAALPVPKPRALKRLRGAFTTQFTSTGLLAHALGKSALRAHRGPIAGIHWPRADKARVQTSETMRLCHFDGLTRLHWALKMQRHLANNILDVRAYGSCALRHDQLRHARDLGAGLDALLVFHDQLRLLPGHVADRLRHRGWLIDTGLDIAGAIARQFPGLTVDLSPAAFDAQLRAEATSPATGRRQA